MLNTTQRTALTMHNSKYLEQALTASTTCYFKRKLHQQHSRVDTPPQVICTVLALSEVSQQQYSIVLMPLHRITHHLLSCCSFSFFFFSSRFLITSSFFFTSSAHFSAFSFHSRASWCHPYYTTSNTHKNTVNTM